MTDKFKQFLELRNLSPLTIKQYLTYEKVFTRLGIPSQDTVYQMCLNHKHPTSRAFLKNYCACYELDFEIPKLKIVHHEIMRDLGGYLTMEQVNKILENCQFDRDYVLFLIMFRCGRRITEVLNLQAKNINFDEGVILFNILKKRREFLKYKPVDSQVIGVLRRYLDSMDFDPDDFLFKGGYDDRPMTRQNAHFAFRKAAEKAGIAVVGSKKPHTHHLRHSHAINFLKNTNSPYALKVVQRQLEHGDLKSTSVYLQFSQKDQKELLEKAFVKK
jgi:integrase